MGVGACAVSVGVSVPAPTPTSLLLFFILCSLLSISSHAQKLPRVDVGSLEEVIVKMEADRKGEWSDVMFVPAGALTAAAAGGKGKK